MSFHNWYSKSITEAKIRNSKEEEEELLREQLDEAFNTLEQEVKDDVEAINNLDIDTTWKATYADWVGNSEEYRPDREALARELEPHFQKIREKLKNQEQGEE